MGDDSAYGIISRSKQSMNEVLDESRSAFGLLESLRKTWTDISSGGREVFDLSMINPDIPPQRLLLDKLVEASLKAPHHRYAVSRGVRKLREAFAQKYLSRWSVKLNPETQVCVTAGTKDAIFQSLEILAQERLGNILLPSPTYPAHQYAAQMLGFRPHYFQVSNQEDLLYKDIESALRASEARVLLLNFPHNPTGMVVSQEFIQKLIALVRQLEVIIVNDFVYGEMGFGNVSPVSMLSAPGAEECVLESYSLSKAYSVPGWRVGALVGNERLIQQVARRKSLVDYGLFLPIQMAAASALSQPDHFVKSVVREYETRNQVLQEELTLGFDSNRRGAVWEVKAPQAGAFVWARIPEVMREFVATSSDLIQSESASLSYRFARYCLSEAGVLLMPGILFGEEWDQYMRFSLVLPREKIREVGRRLRTLVSGAFSESRDAQFSQVSQQVHV